MQRSRYKEYPLHQSPFYCLISQGKLAKLLYITRTKLDELTRLDDLYIEKEKFNPRKKRLFFVQVPKGPLMKVLKRIKDLLSQIAMPSFIHSPAVRRSYITNAKAHINSHEVRSLDIKQYFASSQSWRVYSFFHKVMRCSPDVAGILTKLSTVNGHLPTGSPLSPILSYFAHISMWEAIHEQVRSAGCTLTVYMDDVTISGSSVPDKLIWQVKREFLRCGLRENRDKEKRYVGNKPRKITGVIVNDGKLKIPN
jgi:retron-type reverse transcriptase